MTLGEALLVAACSLACYSAIDVLLSLLKTDTERVVACAVVGGLVAVLAWALAWAMHHVAVHLLL